MDGVKETPKTTTTTTTKDDEDQGGAATRGGDEEEKAKEAKAEEEEEEEECGFCKYMKGGSCKETFIAWEACVDASKEKGEDFVDACFEATSALRECMLKDPEYYGPMVGEESGGDGDGEEDGGGERSGEGAGIGAESESTREGGLEEKTA